MAVFRLSNAGANPRHQRAYIRVIVAGRDVTNKFDPFLLEVTIIKKEEAIDEAHLELDDRYGILKLPDPNDPISIELGWATDGLITSFEGLVSDLISHGQKKTGRRLRIEAKAIDLMSAVKGQVNGSLGDGEKEVSIGDALGHFLPGFDLNIDPELKDKKHKYFKAEHESPMQFATRIAKDVGGIAKFAKQKLTITKAVGGIDPSTGAQFPATACHIDTQGNGNVIGWNIHVLAARPTWGNTGHVHFDPQKAKWNRSQTSVQGNNSMADVSAAFTHLMPVADQTESENKSQSAAWWAEKRHGYGWTMIDGEPAAEPQHVAVLSGYRDGVDGNYRITEVEHHYSRGGFTTRLDIDSPGSV